MELKKYSYKVFPGKRIIIRYYQGSVSLPDLIQSMEETGNDIHYDPTFNVINDFRDAISAVKIGEINKFFGYVKGHKKLYGKRKSAFMVKTPDKTIYSMIMRLLKYEDEVGFKISKDLVEALKWVELPVSDLDFVDKAINDLKMPKN